ncbi:hypothetical protein PY793_06365 [Acetobacter fabarum]|uniref:hypothetical protein n=1 Tax=Acetobacter fabarum TaxID=483199 RepID=UPI00312BAA10
MTDDKNFALWLAKEKRALADAGYQEAALSFDRIKGRLGTVLPLSVTLTTASLAGAFSQREYSMVCAFMALGFGITSCLCAMGLYATTLLSKNVGPDMVDTILSDVPERDETHATLWMAYTASYITAENTKMIEKDRRWLKAVWISLSLTPVVSFLLSVVCGGWGSF